MQPGPASVRVTAENFMEDRSDAPLDEDEIREALAAALTQQAPPALVRFVGKPAYSRWGHFKDASYLLACAHATQ